MHLSTTTDMLIAMFVVMALGTLSGWLAGTGLYYLRRVKLGRRQRRDLLVHILPGVASVLVFLLVLAPLFRELGGSAAVLLGFLAMMIVPFSILGAQTAWQMQSRRHHANEKLRTVSSAFIQLRGSQRRAGRK